MQLEEKAGNCRSDPSRGLTPSSGCHSNPPLKYSEGIIAGAGAGAERDEGVEVDELIFLVSQLAAVAWARLLASVMSFAEQINPQFRRQWVATLVPPEVCFPSRRIFILKCSVILSEHPFYHVYSGGQPTNSTHIC